MHVVEIAPRRKSLDLKQWAKRTALDTDYKTLVREDTLIRGTDGSPLLLYVRLPWDFTALRTALQKIEYQKSTRTSGLKSTSRVFGHQPRIAIRRDFCTSTSLAGTDPEVNELLCDYGRRINKIYKEFFPEVEAKHGSRTEAVLPEWRIPGTVFTSGIINRNNPLKYHFDAGNFSNVCSCMLGFRRDVSGGALALPELDMAFEIADGSLTIFDGQSLLHGVTPLHALTPQSYRFTIVYYALKAMWNCKPLTEEIARARTIRTQREQKRLGLSGPKVGDEIYIDQNGITHDGKDD